MNNQRRYATWPQGMSKKKRRRRRKKDSPHPKEIKEREMVHEKEFIHHPPKKKIYIGHVRLQQKKFREKGILYARSTKCSLFVKKIQGWV